MHTGFARTLLLILLLALAGQALAAPCGSDAGGEMSMPMDMEGNHPSHCASGGDCEEQGEHSADCEQNCGCCPGHCSGALPSGDSKAMALSGPSQATTYRAFNSSPAPEVTLRPPIRHPIPN